MSAGGHKVRGLLFKWEVTRAYLYVLGSDLVEGERFMILEKGKSCRRKMLEKKRGDPFQKTSGGY